MTKSLSLIIILFSITTFDVFSQSSCVTSVNSGSPSQTVCLDSAISTINFNIGDDGNRPDTISGLPAGLSFTVSQFVCITSPCNQNIMVTGTASASGVFPYTVKNANGDCSTSGTTGTITISTSGGCSRNCIANFSTSYDASQN